MDIYIGTSGYTYKHWSNDVFYPKDLSQKRYLEYYCQHFNAVELNVTFYRLPKKMVFEGWYTRTPKKFHFIVKGSRYITHIKRLKDVAKSINLLAENSAYLKEKLSGMLWQFPPQFKRNVERFSQFCDQLKRNSIMKKTRHIFEFRHHSWFEDSIYSILRKNNYCLCFADSPKELGEKVITSNFLYLRFHGRERLYGSNYPDRFLEECAENTLKNQKKIKTIYGFFNNDEKGYAVYNALKFREYLLQ